MNTQEKLIKLIKDPEFKLRMKSEKAKLEWIQKIGYPNLAKILKEF